MAISHCYWHLVVRNGNFTLLLTSSGQEWQFHIATDISVVNNGNFTLLLTSHSGNFTLNDNFTHCYYISWSTMAIPHVYWHLVARMTISHSYWHVVVRNGNFTLLLTCSGKEWQFHIVYWHVVVKNGNFTLLLTSSGQEWQFHIATDS